MTTYKGIRGQTIRTIAGDASPLIVGDIWFNSASKKIKGAKLAAGAWASGGNLNTAREYAAGAGPMTAALCIAGSDAGGRDHDVESYDGSSWTEVGDTNTVRGGASTLGCGTQTAALVAGGKKSAGVPGVIDDTELYDGTSWTEVGDMNVVSADHAGANAGTNTATLAFGGGYPAPHVATNEEWNGTSWTEVNDLNTSRERLCGVGTSTAALAIDGAISPGSPESHQATEQWNGTAWTEVADTSTVHYWGAAFGNSTAALIAGAYPAATHTDEWNGTAWAEAAAFSTSRVLHNAGTGGPGVSEGIIMGGASMSAATEEWTKAVAAVSFTSS